MQFVGLLGTAGGLRELATAAHPLYLADHVAAIASWIGFYVAEAVAVAAVLKAYAGDQAAAVRMRPHRACSGGLWSLPRSMGGKQIPTSACFGAMS